MCRAAKEVGGGCQSDQAERIRLTKSEWIFPKIMVNSWGQVCLVHSPHRFQPRVLLCTKTQRNSTVHTGWSAQTRLSSRVGQFRESTLVLKSWLCKFNQTNKKRKKNLVAQAVRSLTNLVGSNSSLFSLEAMSEGEHQNIPSSLCEHERQHGEPQLLPVTSSQTWTQPSGVRKGSSKNVP